MILIDTSIWIDHLRNGDRIVEEHLERKQVLGHPFVVGELALGHLSPRGEILRLLKNLPQARVATDREVLVFIEQYALMGLGIGYIDAHLLAATLLTAGSMFWTRDKRLESVAGRLGIGASFLH